MTDFEEYIRQGEPGKKERAQNWRTAIGLQQVDGLTVSPYLLDLARQNIEGKITMAEVHKRLDLYHKQKKRAKKQQRAKNEENTASKCKNCTSNRLGVKLSANQMKILQLLKNQNDTTMVELSAKLGVSEVSIYKNMKKLKELGLLSRVGSDKTGHWLVTSPNIPPAPVPQNACLASKGSPGG
jgi:biotin operon repressor